MFDLENGNAAKYMKRWREATESEIEAMMEDVGDIQSMLEHTGFYIIDAKIEEVANGLGLR